MCGGATRVRNCAVEIPFLCVARLGAHQQSSSNKMIPLAEVTNVSQSDPSWHRSEAYSETWKFWHNTISGTMFQALTRAHGLSSSARLNTAARLQYKASHAVEQPRVLFINVSGQKVCQAQKNGMKYHILPTKSPDLQCKEMFKGRNHLVYVKAPFVTSKRLRNLESPLWKQFCWVVYKHVYKRPVYKPNSKNGL
ncbi:hypothetical protein B0H13DRAFT_1882722 [Mycena leptocephala]|nr:hypothetical protein B0H13DRAFT_1882722 [Mycena leptocephala]